MELDVTNIVIQLDPKDSFKWTAFITGLQNTEYDGAIFKLNLVFPKNYPNISSGEMNNNIFYDAPIPYH